MGGNDYKFHCTTFATMGSRTGEIFGPVTLFPNSDVSSEDCYNYDNHAPRKTLVPVATKPYDGDYKHGSPTKAYSARYDDEWHRPTNPVHGTMVPVVTRPYGGYEYRNSSPTKPYCDGDDDECYRPHRDDELLTRRAGVPVPVASRPSGVDEYGHGSPKKANPTRDDGKPHEVLTRRTVPIATRPNGSDYERSSPTARTDPARHDINNKWHGTQKPPANQPVIWTEWRRPQRSAAYNGYEEEPKAIDSTNKSGKPIISQDWSSSPRKGNRLSEVTDDIDKVAEMFIQSARLARASDGEYKAPKPSAKNYDSRDRRNLGVDRPTPTSPASHGLGIPIDARRRSATATIDCREAERKYNGQMV